MESGQTTEWDDILNKFGITSSKQEEKKEEQQREIQTKLEDDELGFDEDDEAVFRRFRDHRIAELQSTHSAPAFGDIKEIAGQDFVQEVNKAGEGIWVVLHLYKPGVPLCTLINHHLNVLSKKFPKTKFLKSLSNLCIANFPDSNLPAIFVYLDGNCKKQLIGPSVFGGMNLQADELEWMLGKIGAFATDIDENPRKIQPKSSKLFISNASDSDD
ncbi:Phosducin-like protein 3 [Halotydeus destructor]|nr:Phosducin-like protein 3 [Halotydeus destructor]